MKDSNEYRGRLFRRSGVVASILVVMFVALAITTRNLQATPFVTTSSDGVAQATPSVDDATPGGATPGGATLVVTDSSRLSADEAIELYLDMHTLTADDLPDLIDAGLVDPADVNVESLGPSVAAPETADAVANLSGSSKHVDQTQATAGTTLSYTIVISNSGNSFTAAAITDTLTPELTYVPDSLSVSANGGTSFGEAGGVITWTGAINAQSQINVSFSAVLTDALIAGETVTNTVVITGTGALLERSAYTEIVSETVPMTTTLYLPVVARALTVPELSVSRPNSNNAWTASWTSQGSSVTYQIQEAQKADFSDAVTYDVNGTSRAFDHAASTQNEYFYRVRTVAGNLTSDWSNVVHVVGAYRDDFDDRSTGWSIRRTTFIEEVRTWYEPFPPDTPTWLIMQVEDSWDWGISSGKARAPQVPYAIEYEAKAANLGNLVSHGLVFGGDWPGSICPDPSTVEGWYQHELCFNTFYNINIIWFGELKMLFERVDDLVWCPDCGGSPMKRLGDIDSDNVRELSGVDPDDWNRYRIEVRADSIHFFAGRRDGGLQHAFTYNDTRYVNQPYVGVFGSTDEYSNSTWRFEYVSITPLD